MQEAAGGEPALLATLLYPAKPAAPLVSVHS